MRQRHTVISAHAGKTDRTRRRTSPPTAHPRSRGENEASLQALLMGRGSSPLTRGKLTVSGNSGSNTRLIPAHAGKTTGNETSASPPRGHPRSRGENMAKPGEDMQATGSSPLTRGKPLGTIRRHNRHRLIPAHAGKTSQMFFPPTVIRAHPRSRGENSLCPKPQDSPSGSSPLTRGKPYDGIQEHCRIRLIPAHAGKTAYNTPPSHHARAHPRSRGENIGGFIKTSDSSGSSPLTRGKHRRDGDRLRLRRLIPAHAGKTWRQVRHRDRDGAHPRSRGENRDLVTRKSTNDGSSPLTRGKHPTGRRLDMPSRLIPAHAGKTFCASALARDSAAHPRSRGENGGLSALAGAELGSSPLTRGKRPDAHRVGSHPRLIPAHAGKTWRKVRHRDRDGAHPRSRGENSLFAVMSPQAPGSSPLTRGKR